MVKRALPVLAALGILVALAYGVSWLVSNALASVTNLSANVAAALVTALAAIVGVLYTQRQNKAKDIAEAHRAEKVKVYRKFMDFISQVLVGTSEGRITSEEDVISPEFKREFISFTSDLIIWGSPTVLKRFAAWRLAAQSDDSRVMLLAVDDLLQAIRKDLRNSNFGLKRGDLMSMYLRDPAELERRVNGLRK